MKDQEYYLYVECCNMESMDFIAGRYTCMVNDYNDFEELEPYKDRFGEYRNYSLARKELLEKYEGK